MNLNAKDAIPVIQMIDDFLADCELNETLGFINALFMSQVLIHFTKDISEANDIIDRFSEGLRVTASQYLKITNARDKEEK